MQEEVENRTVNLAITTTRLSARTIVTGIRMYLNHRNNVSRQKVVQGIHGKQSVKELIGQNRKPESTVWISLLPETKQ